MHCPRIIAAIAIISALFVVADGNLSRTLEQNRMEPCGIVLLGAALPRRMPAQRAYAGAAETACDAVRFECGFTLIELSIVLVIIGLIVGGILVGQDLIGAAATRAQLAQIEKYNTAANTFRSKYNGIPGDLDLMDANNFGFTTPTDCDGTQGRRDGNGLLEANHTGFQLQQAVGENALFWSDLSTAGFTDGQFNSSGIHCQSTLLLSSTGLAGYFPTAKIGGGNFLYVYSVNGLNWFGLSAATSVNGISELISNSSLTVSQAYNMDKKIDDGLPTTGNVVAVYLNGVVAPGTQPDAPNGNPDTSSTCYNNSTNTYSTNVSNGSGPNCALSFRMQGAAR